MIEARAAQVQFSGDLQRHLACLLSGGDDKRSVGLIRHHQDAHRIANPRSGMHVDQRRPTCGLCAAGGMPTPTPSATPARR